MRPTLKDLAEAAGVSTATVDRVLNGRVGVSARTQDLVMSAARRIGYVALKPDEIEPVTLRIVLPEGTNRFISDLGHEFLQQARLLKAVNIDIDYVEGLNPAALSTHLRHLPACDGVGIVTVAHPNVREAIHNLDARNCPVVTLASDLPDAARLAYVGIDNAQAGRLAGQIIGRLVGSKPAGKIAFFAGTTSYRGHLERELGFRQILAEEFGQFSVLDLRESLEDRTRAEELSRAVLDAHPDLCAIYNAGGGTQGIANALDASGRAKDIVFLAHECTVDNRALLLNGTLDAVIDQDASALAREALGILISNARGVSNYLNPPRINLIFRENIPPLPRTKTSADETN